jgi:hypothetical protein
MLSTRFPRAPARFGFARFDSFLFVRFPRFTAMRSTSVH